MRHLSLAWFAAALALAAPAAAQFTGPSVQGTPTTVAAVEQARLGSYVTMTGRITAHLREDYYRFADDSGEIRVEIGPGIFAGRAIGPQTPIRIMGEVDRSAAGARYVWVKSLDIIP
jgi:uncharacterized protein (TIGR00156 family)